MKKEGAEFQACKRTVYCGAFVHSISLQELEICESGAIGVDQNGVISFIYRDITKASPQRLLQKIEEEHGWRDIQVVRLIGEGFFFPGFIGMQLS